MSKKCTALWHEAHFEVKMYKTHQLRTTFVRCDVEKVHAVVARRTFPSENVQNTTWSDHFLKLRCRKSARRCGAKHISKSKCTKHTMFGPLLEAQMSTCEKVHAVVARSTFPSQNVQNTPCSDHFWRLRCRLSKKCTPLWREADFQVKMYKTHHVRTTFGGSDVAALNSTTLHYTTLCCTTLHYTTLHYYTSQHYRLQLQLRNYSPLHSTTLHYTKVHCTTLSTLHFATLHDTTLHYTTNTTTPTQLHSTTLHYTTLHYTRPHYTTLHYATLQNLPLHFTTLLYTTLHYTTPTTTTTVHYTPLHYTTLHYITLNDAAPKIDR